MKNLDYRKCFAVLRAIGNRMPDFPLMSDPGDKKFRIQHVKGIHKKKAEIAKQIGANSYPKCGKELIVRKSKYGDFKRCTNYPKCRFTITPKLSDEF
ncbi:topoisomerase DNA-binding C4 zinc finger domain-containing protein [Desulfosporosinus sp.]|uniref:topoisomerase DNA-binding C4 zinc finger domain-containing protein n=1 Tax=Desulfosporosinus sp. TaxID=157907 RepID=UPI0025C0D363|nr:topoisomerase DNA-binding C4 zinc finger domain-containing protein [Desulfosporosinus sp.]MBC2724191.1 topoisomerase DNA-binding C4 zinc finger domain-containing protein [Desulfosporosinus sp.]MBC2726723.1 topoisomerase DNA-binding C4 zinc finger domain-containing protein [Desulfosporosinus sp.]